MVKTTGFVKVLSIVLCVLTLPTITFFVGWLSNMREPSEHLRQLLMAGEVHSILFNAEYWRLAWSESGISHLEIAMFIHREGHVGTIVVLIVLFVLMRPLRCVALFHFTCAAFVFVFALLCVALSCFSLMCACRRAIE